MAFSADFNTRPEDAQVLVSYLVSGETDNSEEVVLG